MQQHLIDEGHDGRDLVGDDLGRVEVAGVEAERGLARDGVGHVELVGTDGVALGANAEQLAFDGDDVVLVRYVGVHDLVERREQALARRRAVGRHVLHAVRNPDVHRAGRAELLAEVVGDAAAGDAVVDPELADDRIGMRQRHAVDEVRVRETARVEVQPDAELLRPVDPRFEVLRLDLVARHLLFGVEIDGVQVEALGAGDQRHRLFGVLAQLGGRLGFARIVSGRLDAAAQCDIGHLETGDVVALPAVHRYRNGGKRLEGGVGINAGEGVALLGLVVGGAGQVAHGAAPSGVG